MKYPKFATAVVSGVLALSLGLVGCGGGGSDTSTTEKKEETVEVEEETTGEEEKVDTTTGKETKTDDTEAEAEDDEAAEIENLEAEVDEWANAAAWMGFDENGETLYYIESTENSSAMMVVYDPETNEFVTFIGSATNDGAQVTITDEDSGASLTFEITAVDEDDNLVIDMGEQGEAVLASAKPAEVFEAMMAIAEGAEHVDFNAVEEEVDQWADTAAWMGLSDQGETFYYIESTTDSSAMMVVYDPETNSYVSFVGTAEQVSDDQVTITDATTGLSLTFQILEADEDGNLAIDMGEQGQAILASATTQEVFEAIAAINDGAEAVA